MKSSKVIGVVNYGMGNIGSVVSALEVLGGRFCVSGDPGTLLSMDGYILPGVGAFPEAMNNLNKSGLTHLLTSEVKEREKPFLGICLGMQMLALDSIELQFTNGLGWIDGHIMGMNPGEGLRVPHVGWNDTILSSGEELFTRIPSGAHFFYDHSYHFVCNEPECIVATFSHGEKYVAALRKKNIFATQFHPEKSQRNGLKLLRNFLNYVEQKEPNGVAAC